MSSVRSQMHFRYDAYLLSDPTWPQNHFLNCPLSFAITLLNMILIDYSIQKLWKVFIDSLLFLPTTLPLHQFLFCWVSWVIASKALTLFCFPMKKLMQLLRNLKWCIMNIMKRKGSRSYVERRFLDGCGLMGFFSCATVERLYTHIHSHLSHQGYTALICSTGSNKESLLLKIWKLICSPCDRLYKNFPVEIMEYL